MANTLDSLRWAAISERRKTEISNCYECHIANLLIDELLCNLVLFSVMMIYQQVPHEHQSGIEDKKCVVSVMDGSVL